MRKIKERSTAVQVKCPNCKQRMYDMEANVVGDISIKCVKCGAVFDVSMHHKNYRCKRQIVTQA